VAHAQRNTGNVYLAVRLGPGVANDPALIDALNRARATAIVDGRLAAHSPDTVRRLRNAGVDLANGGWGHRDRVHWGRARSDLVRATRAIHAAGGGHFRTFVPQRRIDGFDLASARLVHERVVVPNAVISPGDVPAHVRAGHVWVIDGRNATPAQLLRSLDEVGRLVIGANLGTAPLAQMQ